MSDKVNDQQERPLLPSEEWTLSQGDLGLKAGFWNDSTRREIVFRPIVGWIVYHGVNLAVPTQPATNGFSPVVVSDRMWPTLAGSIEGYVGVFLKDMTPSQAREKAAEWAGDSGQDPKINTLQRGQA